MTFTFDVTRGASSMANPAPATFIGDPLKLSIQDIIAGIEKGFFHQRNDRVFRHWPAGSIATGECQAFGLKKGERPAPFVKPPLQGT